RPVAEGPELLSRRLRGRGRGMAVAAAVRLAAQRRPARRSDEVGGCGLLGETNTARLVARRHGDIDALLDSLAADIGTSGPVKDRSRARDHDFLFVGAELAAGKHGRYDYGGQKKNYRTRYPVHAPPPP